VNKEELSYIAGFLDGDGCIMLQLIRRKDYKLGYEIRPSIVFYQKTINEYFLFWLKSKLKFGYIRKRKDGMSEYTIVGIGPVKKIILQINPFLKLKKKHGKLAMHILMQMPKTGKEMTARKLLKLSLEVDKFIFLNYSKKRTNTSIKVKEYLISHNFLSP